MSWYHYNHRKFMYGPQLTYAQADEEIKKKEKRHKDTKYHWKRADHYSWWMRAKDADAIDLRCGWKARFGGGSRLLRIHKNGAVTALAVTDIYSRYRLNHYNPFRDRWYFFVYARNLFLHDKKESIDQARLIDPTFYMRSTRKWSRKRCAYPRYVFFDADGNLTYPLTSTTYRTFRKNHIKEANLRNAPYKRGWYWLRRSRNLFLDQSKCRKTAVCVSWNQWRTPPARTFDCGCRTYRKKQRPFKKTVQDIMAENNATVRAAWIQMYGIGKFFEDMNARTIAYDGDYKLLNFSMHGNIYRALKMTCPSTGTVHVNLVHPSVHTVQGALNWMFNVSDFKGMVGHQT